MPFFAGCNISNDFIRCVIVSHTGEIAAEKSGLADGGQAFAGNLNMNLDGKKIDLCKKIIIGHL